MKWIIIGFVIVLAIEFFIRICDDGGETDTERQSDYEDIIVPYLPQVFDTFSKKFNRRKKK